MIFLIYFLLITLTYTHKCSFKTPIKYEQIYLCREKLNSTSLRIWLHLKLNTTNLFSYYSFTLRIIHLIEKHKIHLKDHFEKQISEYVQINSHSNESNTINLHNLPPGRYEICVNFLNKNTTKIFYYRSSNSCLHIPWNVLEHEKAQPHLFIYILFIILIIILLVTIVFFIYSLHQCFKSRKIPVPVIIENIDEDYNKTEHAKFLVNKHFSQRPNSFELLVRRRFHQRYAHRSSPDLNDT
jgi:hypothetical protein